MQYQNHNNNRGIASLIIALMDVKVKPFSLMMR